MSKITAAQYYRSLPKEQQELIDNVMLSTMDMCADLIGEAVVFPEIMAYQCMRWEMLDHMLNDEYYDHRDRTWKKHRVGKEGQ